MNNNNKVRASVLLPFSKTMNLVDWALIFKRKSKPGVKVSESLVVEAMKRAVEQGKHYWSYVDAILVKWEQMNVRDVKDARAKEFQMMFEKVHKRKLYSDGRKPVRTEKLPDWFTEEELAGVSEEKGDEEFEAEKAKLMAELEAYREQRTGVVM